MSVFGSWQQSRREQPDNPMIKAHCGALESLFEMEPVLSPRLAWMFRNGISTKEFSEAHPEQRWRALLMEDEDEGLSFEQAMERNCRKYEEHRRIGYGRDETEALQDLAVYANIKLWNEEGVK